MPRIQPVRLETADPKTAELLSSVKQKLGMVPNLISTMAQSPVVAHAYLGFSQILGSGLLPATLREQIALTVAQANKCDYCLAAHSVLGPKVGLSMTDVTQARHATAVDAKAKAALVFARKLVELHGRISDSDLRELHHAGYVDSEVNEIVANVVLNIFTNYINHVADTEIDFPVAPTIE